MSEKPTKQLYVLQVHRENLRKCNTFEEFKKQQLRFLDYLVADQKSRDRAEEALVQFAAPAMEWIAQVRVEQKEEEST